MDVGERVLTGSILGGGMLNNGGGICNLKELKLINRVAKETAKLYSRAF